MTADYDSAIAAIQQIADDGYRNAAIEAVILHRVVKEKGFNDPAGELAMQLRREAAALKRGYSNV